MSADMTYYNKVLAGERVAIIADEPKHGYYRHMKRDVVAIYPDPDGNTVITLNGFAVDDPYKRSDIWVGCANKPITQEVFAFRTRTGRWPEEEAQIKKSASLKDNLGTFAKKVAEYLDSLSEKRGIIEHPEDTVISNQLEADLAAGYVQQIRAMVGEAETTVKLQLEPLKDEIAAVNKEWKKPFDSLEEAKGIILGDITEYAKKVMRESNDPNFKFAAGKAGDAKTIALKKTSKYVIDDFGQLLKRFKGDAAVVAAVREAILKAAITAHKAEKTLPKGLKLEDDYQAV